jgi:NAD(P)-dependent dehydrogenase (short-subunit alcohol dehydrogenase family)
LYISCLITGLKKEILIMNRLKDKVALITGANSGIGRVTAELFAKEGASVVMFARNKERLKEVEDGIVKNGGKALSVSGDVTSAADCKKVFGEAVNKFGKVDILVNNAGIVDLHTPVIRVTDKLWQDVININQTGTFLFCREALEYMTKAKKGVIVNVSSIAGVYGNGGAAYSASKFAVIGLTKNIAIQYAGTDIRCNAMCPGPTPTPLNTPDKIEKFDKEFTEICSRHTDHSVGDSGAIDQANAILFLSNDESRCITGQVLVVDRGMCL